MFHSWKLRKCCIYLCMWFTRGNSWAVALLYRTRCNTAFAMILKAVRFALLEISRSKLGWNRTEIDEKKTCAGACCSEWKIVGSNCGFLNINLVSVHCFIRSQLLKQVLLGPFCLNFAFLCWSVNDEWRIVFL